MIKKRTRPQQRLREPSPEPVADSNGESGDEKLPLADLIELRRLRKARQGIDATKLNKGDVKKKRKRSGGDELEGGLKQVGSSSKDQTGNEDDEEGEKEARARRAVRSNNFTQQTNALDVDKHMMAYIEENLKLRSRPVEEPEEPAGPLDPQEELFRTVADRWKVDKKPGDDGSVTNSLTMLTAIPEVDLGMDTRLKNIEETEKAKRVVAEVRRDRKKPNADEAHLAAARFYRPTLRQKSDADILREAKMEAMGIPVQDDVPRTSQQERAQMASDEIVMERFKKRMRK